MNNVRMKAFALLLAGVLGASACSSGADVAEQVEAAQPDDVEETTVDSTTAPTTTTEAPEPEESTTAEAVPETQIVIEGEVTFGPNFGTGTWEATTGADILGCAGGTMEEFGAYDAQAGEMACAGDRSGAFVGLFAPSGGGSTFTSTWDVIAGTGDFADLSGIGSWSGEINADGTGSMFTITLDEVAFADVAAPVENLPRLSQQRTPPCWDGFVTTDGLVEYATVGDTMLRLDLETGERTEHGEPPSECAWWLGDPDLGRRVALSLPGGDMALPGGEWKVWLGPYDGAWDVELTFDEITLLLSRSFTANRLLLSQPDSGRAILIDATTGDQVGADIEGSFADGRSSSASASSDDGRFIAVGGAATSSNAGDGELIILDAATGDQLATFTTDAPPTTLDFDDSADELVVGLFTGALITIDLATMEVVSEVSLEETAVIASLGVRPDGLVVVVTEDGAALVDRTTGPTGVKIDIRLSGASAVRPDGSITSLLPIQRFEVYEIAG